MQKFLFLALFFASTISLAQTFKERDSFKGILFSYKADSNPEFPGGNHALKQFLFSHIQYPAKAIQQHQQGDINVWFVIDTTGAIDRIDLKGDFSKACNKEVLRVIKLMPLWKPATKDDKKVPVWYGFTIPFRLPTEQAPNKLDTTRSFIPYYIGEKDGEPYIAVEQMPRFPGGEEALKQYLSQHLKYPTQARAAGIEGRVFVSFIVSSTGQVKDVTIAKGIGYGCDEEAIRLTQAMPDWTPGMQNGKKVPVRYSISIRFQL